MHEGIPLRRKHKSDIFPQSEREQGLSSITGDSKIRFNLQNASPTECLWWFKNFVSKFLLEMVVFWYVWPYYVSFSYFSFPLEEIFL